LQNLPSEIVVDLHAIEMRHKARYLVWRELADFGSLVDVEASEDTGGCVWADAKECSESCLNVTRLLMVISEFEQRPRMSACTVR
jgi:hypothetical protein